MSSQYEEQFDENGDPIEAPPAPEAHTNAEWAALRREKRKGETAEARALAAEKDLAFMRAGIDTATNPMAEYFVKGYDGEMTADAIKAKAIEVGLLAAPVPPPPDPVKQESLAAAERISQGAQGGGSVTPVGTSALDEAFVQGGTEAMIEAARGMGIPIQNEQ